MSPAIELASPIHFPHRAQPGAVRMPAAPFEGHPGVADPRSGGRGLHLVDAENLLGGYLTPDRLTYLLQMYARIAPVQPGDEVWVGLAPATARSVDHVVPERYGLAVGEDGVDSADYALSDVACRIGVAHRFARVCIGSGDGHLAETAVWCSRHGVRSYALSGEGWVSAELRLAVAQVVPLPMRACYELLRPRRA